MKSLAPNAHGIVLFLRASKQKQVRHPSTDRWLSKLWYIRIMEYCSRIKRWCLRDSSVMKSTGFSFRGPRINSQHFHESSPLLTPI